jgi:transcriptional regulator GlxA family with amidase domain
VIVDGLLDLWSGEGQASNLGHRLDVHQVLGPELVGQLIGSAVRDRLAADIDERLAEKVGEEGRALVAAAAQRIPSGVQVPELADVHGLSVSTLERRCARWGLMTPGHVLLWLRVAYGLNWLTEPGRSVESVAGQLGYSSGAAFRRALKVSGGGRPTPLRNRDGLESAMAAFIEACPGEPEEVG